MPFPGQPRQNSHLRLFSRWTKGTGCSANCFLGRKLNQNHIDDGSTKERKTENSQTRKCECSERAVHDARVSGERRWTRVKSGKGKTSQPSPGKNQKS